MRRFAALALVAAAAALFFLSIDALWPVVPFDPVPDGRALDRLGRAALERLGYDLDGFRSSHALALDTAALDHLDRTLGRARTREWIEEGAPLVRRRLTFKRAGDPTAYRVALDPAGRLLGWERTVEDDEPGAALDAAAARDAALRVLRDDLGLESEAYREIGFESERLPARVDHAVTFERVWQDRGNVRERVVVRLAGDRPSAAMRGFVVPPEVRRAARAAAGPGRALETLGFALLAAATAAAFVVFLDGLARRRIELRDLRVWPTLVFACLLATYALQANARFEFWETLWQRWISDSRYVVLRGIGDLWVPVVVLVVVGAGNLVDRESGAARGWSLAQLARGRWRDPGVARASRVGFAVGLLCGGAMTVAVLALERLAGAGTALQPRGFFLYVINASSPALASVLFFLGVALAEELGYRYFAGGWLLRKTGRAWVAVVVPAAIYGLTHTRLDFLPPAHPEWSRALVLTLVGCVWGWAFLRYDALTVVLSHLTADLFIFNWPRLASGEPAAVAAAAAALAVPLLPGLAGLVGLGTPPGGRPNGVQPPPGRGMPPAPS